MIADHSEKDRRCTSQSQEILTLSDQVQKLSTELKLISSAKDDLTHNVRTCIFQSISRISYDSHLCSTSEVDVFEYSISDVILPIPYLIGRQEINIWIVFVFRCH